MALKGLDWHRGEITACLSVQQPDLAHRPCPASRVSGISAIPIPLGADEAAVVPWRGANPDYPPYACRADEVHVVGKVVWKFTRA